MAFVKRRRDVIYPFLSFRRLKLEFHGADTDTDTDTDILADFRVTIVTSLTRTRILADLSDTRDFPREDPREDVR